jgi:hypothetical protein
MAQTRQARPDSSLESQEKFLGIIQVVATLGNGTLGLAPHSNRATL